MESTPPPEAMILLDHALQHFGITEYTVGHSTGVEPYLFPGIYMSCSEGARPQQSDVWTMHWRAWKGDVQVNRYLEWHDDHWTGWDQLPIVEGGALYINVYTGPVISHCNEVTA